MGKALADAFPICRETFAEADAALGEPLSRLCFEGPEDRADADRERAAGDSRGQHRRVSPARRRVGCTPAFVAGHSLGEYSANVAAGTFAFADALRMVRRRGRYMQEAVPVGEGAMAAILGLDADKVAQACAEAARRRGRQPGEHERRRTGRDCRRARRGRSARASAPRRSAPSA